MILSIKTIEELPWEDRRHRHSHNITSVILPEDQGNNKFLPFYRIGIKHRTVILSNRKWLWYERTCTDYNVIKFTY